MSKNGHVFEIDKGKSLHEEQDGIRESMNNAESAMALRLLQSKFLVTDPDTGAIEALDIEKVETFPGLDEHYAKAFDSKERTPNSLFVIKHRQMALVVVVVDPKARSVIRIVSVNAANNPSKSIASHLQRILGSKEALLDLDGVSLDDPNSGIELAQKKRDGIVMKVAVTARKEIQASAARSKIRDKVLVPTSSK